MVCIYCSAPTQVINSRLQKRLNQVWRRRRCTKCHNVFTTHEILSYEGALAVRDARGKLSPFLRDRLLVSLHTSCAHRPTALSDAIALTNTILARLRILQQQGAIESTQISQTASEVLKRFDNAAYVHYQAFHPLPRQS